MPSPNLPLLLKHLAASNMALAKEIANPRLINDTRRAKIFEESQRIVADLQRFTDHFVIPVTARNKVGR